MPRTPLKLQLLASRALQNNHTNKLKTKLEQNLDDLEDTLEREKRSRAEMDKAKRKTEGELRIAQENIEEVNKQKADLENNIKVRRCARAQV